MTQRKNSILQMLELEPTDEFLNYALAIELESEGEIELAIETLLKLKLHHPNYLAIYLKLAELYANNGEEEKAIGTANNGIQLAKKQNNKKVEGELNVLLMELED